MVVPVFHHRLVVLQQLELVVAVVELILFQTAQLLVLVVLGEVALALGHRIKLVLQVLQTTVAAEVVVAILQELVAMEVLE